MIRPKKAQKEPKLVKIGQKGIKMPNNTKNSINGLKKPKMTKYQKKHNKMNNNKQKCNKISQNTIFTYIAFKLSGNSLDN